MKLRLVKQRTKLLFLCPNGSIIKADNDELLRLLTRFNSPNNFKGHDGVWNSINSDIQNYPGQTVAYINDQNKLVILDEKLFSFMGKDNLISVTEYADKHGKGRAIVKRLCADGRIEGAEKHSIGWMIPANAPYPKRKKKIENKNNP